MALTTVIQGMLANDAVISTTISAENVKGFDIALSAVSTRHIESNAIQTYHLSSNVIDSRIIASSAVTTRHYAASSIQNVHLSVACVHTSNIAVSAVTVDKLNLDVFQNLRGSKILRNTNPTLVFSNSNYIFAHGAIILNVAAAPTSITLSDASNPPPANFHCWILNASLNHLDLFGGDRELRGDERKFTPAPGQATIASGLTLSGSYVSGSQKNAFPMVYVFSTNDQTLTPVFYVIPYFI